MIEVPMRLCLQSTPIARVEGRGIKWGTVAPPRSSRQGNILITVDVTQYVNS